jgi:PAS domain S-box-containing protein
MKKTRSLRVLTIDDDPEIGAAIKRMLEKKFKASVDLAADIDEGRRRLSSTFYDLVTIDSNALDLLRETDSWNEKPAIIVVSGYTDRSLAEEVLALGALAYVPKDNNLERSLSFEVRKVEMAVNAKEPGPGATTQMELMGLALDKMQDTIAMVDLTGRYIFWNKRLSDITGYSDEEISSMNITEMHSAKDIEALKRCMSRVLGGESVTLETHARTKDGRLIPFEMRGDLLSDSMGNPLAICGVGRNISEQAIDRDRINFQAHLLNCVDSAVIAAEPGGTITYWNNFAEKLFGYKADEAIGENVIEMLLPEARKQTAERLRAEAGDTWSGEVELVRKDRTRFTALVHKSPIIHGGTAIGIVGVVVDASERKRTEERLHSMIHETNQRREEITALLESTRTVLESTEFEPAARTVFNVCRNLVGASAGYLALGTAEVGSLELLFTHPEDLIEFSEAHGSMPAVGPALAVLSSRKASYVNDFMKSPTGKKVPRKHPTFNNVLFAPLMIESEARGLMMLADKPDGFDRQDLMMAQAFGEILSLALRSEQNMSALKVSEAIYRAVVEDQVEMITRWQPEGILTFVNDAAARFLSVDREDLIGRVFPDTIHPDDAERVWEELAKISVENPVVDTEHRILVNGNEYWTHWTNRGFFDDDGNLVEMQGVGRDVTSRKVAELELVESEELYRGLVKASPDAVVLTDLEGTILYMSDSMIEMSGFDESEIVGKSAESFVISSERELMRKGLIETLRFGSLNSQEYTMSRKDGSWFIGELNATVLYDSNGQRRGFIGTIRDTTERKRAEQELQRLNIELEGYAHAVSHDLRSPLTNIGLAAATLVEMVKNKGLDQDSEIMNVTHIIEGNVRKSSKLIEDVLELAEASQMPLEIEEVDISGIVSRVLDDNSVLIAENNVLVEVGRDLGSLVANDTQMYQLFSNLIRNAIIHNDNEGPAVRISHDHEPDTGIHRYRVSDNGPGIPEDEFENIFTPFYSMGPTGESGIGLSTVKKIVSIYDGDIQVSSGNGAVFEFTLRDIDI